MNTTEHEPSPSDLPTAAGADEAGALAPAKRKRAPRKTAPLASTDLPGEAGVAAPSAAEVFVAAASSDDVAAKPKRTRRKVADGGGDVANDASAAAVPQPAAVVAAVEPAGQMPAASTPLATPKPRTRRAPVADAAPVELIQVETKRAAVAERAAPAEAVAASAAVQPALSSAKAAPHAAQAASPAVASSPNPADTGSAAQASQAATGAPEQPAEGEAGETEGSRRNRRNRRRGRRGGSDRPDRDAGSAPGPSEAFQVVTVEAGGDDDIDDGDTTGGADAAPAAPAPRATPVDAEDTFAAVLSGDYDADPTVPDLLGDPEKRVLLPEPDAPKLHKVLAQAGIGSRRDMEQLILDGQVQVNGQVAHTGQRVSFGDRIAVAGKLIKVRIAPPPARVIAYHKVVGEVVTNDDPQHRPTVFRRLPRLPQGKWQSVGRLDINTEGLLLFTNSGELANQLMHPRFGVEREYAVRVLGTLDNEARARLLDGVDIEGQRAAFKSVEDGGGEGVNRWYRVVITEGRNREVRKLFDKVGLGVSRLIRIRYGCVVLPRGLKRGVWVDLSADEVGEVRRLAGNGQERAAPRDYPRDGQAGGQAGGQRDGQRGSQRGGQRDPSPRGGPRDGQGQGQGQGPRPPRQEGQGGGGQGGQGGKNRRTPPPQRNERDRPPQPEKRDREYNEFAAIPNPLMQTFDKRAIREARQPRREIPEDGPIPNPLEQTYDKRFVQKPRGLDGSVGGRKGGGGGNGGQPDPMKTSVGYIGADAFVRKFQGNGGGGGGGGGGNRGGRRRGGR